MQFLGALACLLLALAYALPSPQGPGSLSASVSYSSSRDAVPPQMDIDITTAMATTSSNSTEITTSASDRKALQCEPDPCIKACHLALTIITIGVSCYVHPVRSKVELGRGSAG
ncbi:hypothetical protein MCOR27_006727 [Pyricularia oryzae]|uniref:Uncharacterized protein n=1 Tax=Pyricularia grisea TaxID=148305 RepID=A0ABQ8NYI8_PYRGI|nr:hypothetical protein MCOR19_007609 [Pyricularia oryzae]KAI6303910.1 hypothetical protein MCOR33_001079 [Pyricularia grisea]KAI6275950.1 hypothetical protein MCOR27_006727 [Pyricularia oryzae]KAI6307690.1 hypothetical protein MCOR34_007482 [Pyricularia oryzae]KAI6317034.1 hypothetical protein MCOR29_006484 [Pyricularia oryzae]